MISLKDFDDWFNYLAETHGAGWKVSEKTRNMIALQVCEHVDIEQWTAICVEVVHQQYAKPADILQAVRQYRQQPPEPEALPPATETDEDAIELRKSLVRIRRIRNYSQERLKNSALPGLLENPEVLEKGMGREFYGGLRYSQAYRDLIEREYTPAEKEFIFSLRPLGEPGSAPDGFLGARHRPSDFEGLSGPLSLEEAWGDAT